MKRRRFTVLAIVSALFGLFFVVAALHWYLQPHSDFYSVFLHTSVTPQTHITVSHEFRVSHTTDAVVDNIHYSNVRQTIDWRFLGFHVGLARQVYYPKWESNGDNQTVEWGPVAEWEFALPGWACVIASGIMPVKWVIMFVRWRREIKRLKGTCLHCGYDLRATPDRCPECGTAVAKGTV